MGKKSEEVAGLIQTWFDMDEVQEDSIVPLDVDDGDVRGGAEGYFLWQDRRYYIHVMDVGSGPQIRVLGDGKILQPGDEGY
jgi:hypothetical protein